MALTLIKEDGTGKADANSYADVADGDTYHDGHLYGAAWSGASTATKEAALVMASRVLDSVFAFFGLKASSTQALQWPRQQCPDPDGASALASDAVPAAVRQATCELARLLILEDRTDDPDGQGLASVAVTGSLSVVYAPNRLPAIVTPFIRAMLGRVGNYLSATSGSVRLIRT